MAASSFHPLLLLPFLFFLFLSFTSHLAAQPPSNLGSNFSCALDSGSNSSCKAYVSYFVQPGEFSDLEKISNLFGVNSSEIVNASNLGSVDYPLFPHQHLLIPVICGCTNHHFYANLTFRIQKGENFYVVSTTVLENLTRWEFVEDLNPAIQPDSIQVGDEVVFPLFCKCPSQENREKDINYLITYIWQPEDDLQQVSQKFNASPFGILNENNYPGMDSAVDLPVMIPVSTLPELPQSLPESRKNGNRRILIDAGSFGGSILIFAGVIGLICFGRSFRKHKSSKGKDSSTKICDLMNKTEEDPENQISKSKIIQDKLLSSVSGSLGKPVLYESKTLLEATTNFNESCRIGGFVYRAAINGKILAVKSTEEDITEEVKILQKVNHVNLVKLMGFSPNNDRKCFLVYEYAENGSLDRWLFSDSEVSSSFQGCLPWSHRLQIALDVANGLHYMHEHVRPNIVHRDLRSENILLDSDFKAKIANFSTAKPASTSVSPKLDVLAFGIVLLELLSGKKGVGAKENGEMVMAWKEVRGVLEVEEEREERLRKWMDPKLGDSYSINGALSMAGLAKACTSDMPLARPSISEIVFNLSVLVQSAQKSWVFGLEAKVSQHLNPLSPR